MTICNNKKCSIGECDQPETCKAYVPVITNAERIRAMTDEDLADFLAYTWATSARAWQKDTGETLQWLKQRAEGENENERF